MPDDATRDPSRPKISEDYLTETANPEDDAAQDLVGQDDSSGVLEKPLERSSNLIFDIATLLVALALLGTGFFSLRYVMRSYNNTREIAALSPLSYAQVNDTAAGARWLISGLIHFEGLPEPNSKMVVYIFEEFVNSEDGGYWKTRQTHTPPLRIDLQGKLVELEDVQYRTVLYPHSFIPWENQRYRGFKAGDRVTVVGQTLSRGTFDVTLLSGGSQSATVQDLKFEPLNALIFSVVSFIAFIIVYRRIKPLPESDSVHPSDVAQR